MKSIVRTAIARSEVQVPEELISFVNDSSLPVPLRYHMYTEIPGIDREKTKIFLRELATGPNVPVPVQTQAQEILERATYVATVTYAELNQLQTNLILALQTNKYSVKEEFRTIMERLLTGCF